MLMTEQLNHVHRLWSMKFLTNRLEAGHSCQWREVRVTTFDMLIEPGEAALYYGNTIETNIYSLFSLLYVSNFDWLLLKPMRYYRAFNQGKCRLRCDTIRHR